MQFHVPPDAFYPPPKVQSSVIKLIPHAEYPHVAKNYELFADIVRSAFGQRRKTLRNSLKNVIEPHVWEKVSVRPDLRAEKLTVKDFVEISNAAS